MSRKIDALVAEHVMGADLIKDPVWSGPHYSHKGNSYPVITYSVDMGAAWEVVKMFDFFTIDRSSDCKQPYLARVGQIAEAKADTAPMAICLAALKAKGIVPGGEGEG